MFTEQNLDHLGVVNEFHFVFRPPVAGIRKRLRPGGIADCAVIGSTIAERVEARDRPQRPAAELLNCRVSIALYQGISCALVDLPAHLLYRLRRCGIGV